MSKFLLTAVVMFVGLAWAAESTKPMTIARPSDGAVASPKAYWSHGQDKSVNSTNAAKLKRQAWSVHTAHVHEHGGDAKAAKRHALQHQSEMDAHVHDHGGKTMEAMDHSHVHFHEAG